MLKLGRLLIFMMVWGGIEGGSVKQKCCCLVTIEWEGGPKKTFLLTVVDSCKLWWKKIRKSVEGC